MSGGLHYIKLNKIKIVIKLNAQKHVKVFNFEKLRTARCCQSEQAYHYCSADCINARNDKENKRCEKRQLNVNDHHFMYVIFFYLSPMYYYASPHNRFTSEQVRIFYSCTILQLKHVNLRLHTRV